MPLSVGSNKQDEKPFFLLLLRLVGALFCACKVGKYNVSYRKGSNTRINHPTEPRQSFLQQDLCSDYFNSLDAFIVHSYIDMQFFIVGPHFM